MCLKLLPTAPEMLRNFGQHVLGDINGEGRRDSQRNRITRTAVDID